MKFKILLMIFQSILQMVFLKVTKAGYKTIFSRNSRTIQNSSNVEIIREGEGIRNNESL